MSRRPTLSPSRIATYLACPAKYRWTYIDARGKWYLRSKSYYSFGSTLHAVLQRFHDSGDQGVTTTHEALAALEESWIEAGYSSQAEMMEAMAEGKAIVENYLDAVQAQPTTAKTLYIEKLLRLDLGPFVLIGRVDRVDELEDGRLEIIDYKSGRESVSESEVLGDLAMGCYQLLLRAAHPDREVCASIVALRGNQKATVSLPEADLDDLRRDLLVIGGEILNRNWDEVTPVPKRLCLRCDFVPLCKKHPEFELPGAAP